MVIFSTLIIGIVAYYALGCVCIKSEVFGLNILGRFIEKKWLDELMFSPIKPGETQKENLFLIAAWPLFVVMVGGFIFFTVFESLLWRKVLKVPFFNLCKNVQGIIVDKPVKWSFQKSV